MCVNVLFVRVKSFRKKKNYLNTLNYITTEKALLKKFCLWKAYHYVLFTLFSAMDYS